MRQAENVHEDHDTRPLRKAERLRLACVPSLWTLLGFVHGTTSWISAL
jgi:hypothetical protein